MNKTIYPASFFTAKNLNWNHLLQLNEHKKIILDSLGFLVRDKRMTLYVFVIMSNHIHLIWQPFGDHAPKNIQHCFLKYTAQQIKFNLLKNDPIALKRYKVVAPDREY